MARYRGLALAILLLLPGSGSWIGASARALAGSAVGLVTGLGVSVGLVVARARFEHRYVESVHDLYGPDGIPIALGIVGGIAAGIAGGAELAGTAVGAVTGGALGAGIGAAIGVAAKGDSQGTWSWGVVVGAVGMLLGALLGLVRGRRHHREADGDERRDERRDRGAGAWMAPALVLLALGGAASAVLACGGGSGARPAAEAPDGGPPAVPANPAPPRAVVFFAGDPGQATYDRYPVLPRLAGDVAEWSGRVPHGAEVVLMLGDIVYPAGMPDRAAAGYGEDSARVADQVRVVSRPEVAGRGVRMYFLAGNHDWGLREDQEGARRLENLGRFLDRARAAGAPVALAPPAGTGGPQAVDVGPDLRLLLLDTAWWIFDAEPAGKEAFLRRFRQALADAGDRTVIVAAHHPLETGGPHGGVSSLWTTLGVQYVLNRSGALLQDLSSERYVALRKGMAQAFRSEHRPLLYAAGHDHSLQVFRADSAGAPRFSVVSGSASKLSPVGEIEGTLYDRSEPGYMRVVTRTDGSVDLYVEATMAGYQSCPDPAVDRQANLRCMREAMAAFRTAYSARLRPPRPVAESGRAGREPRRARGGPDASGSPPAPQRTSARDPQADG